jgi:hypothetical protein
MMEWLTWLKSLLCFCQMVGLEHIVYWTYEPHFPYLKNVDSNIRLFILYLLGAQSVSGPEEK